MIAKSATKSDRIVIRLEGEMRAEVNEGQARGVDDAG